MVYRGRAVAVGGWGHVPLELRRKRSGVCSPIPSAKGGCLGWGRLSRRGPRPAALAPLAAVRRRGAARMRPGAVPRKRCAGRGRFEARWSGQQCGGSRLASALVASCPGQLLMLSFLRSSTRRGAELCRSRGARGVPETGQAPPPPPPVKAGVGQGAGPGRVPAAVPRTRTAGAHCAARYETAAARGAWRQGAEADGAAGEAALGGLLRYLCRPYPDRGRDGAGGCAVVGVGVGTFRSEGLRSE